MSESSKLCTVCGSKDLAGPYVTNSYMPYGVFSFIREQSYVCLNCGHVENFCSGYELDKARRRAMKEQEKQNRTEKYESI